MAAFFDWLGNNWGWIFLFFLVFGSGIATFFNKLFDSRHQIKALERENTSLRQQLEQQVRPQVAGGDAHTAARMAVLLTRVQEANKVVPQLSDDLEARIDAELEAYHSPSAIQSPKRKGKKP